jgi:hypothetical protein
MKALHLLALGSVLSASLVFAQSTATPPAKTAPATTTKPAPKAAPSAADIADAKAKGMVWFNNNTKVYHKSTDKEYGTTKNGKFMTEADAKAAGGKLGKS